MKKVFVTLFVLILSSFFLYTHAQSQFTGWLASFNTFKISKKTSIHADIQLRSANEIKQIQTILLRAGLNYHVNKKLTLTAGYAYIRNKRIFPNVTAFAPEHRIWEQLLYTHKLKNIFVAHRFRIEQRFIGKSLVVNNQYSTDGYLYANRFRYFLRNVLPLKKAAAFKKGMFVALQDEVFLNFGNTSNVNGKTFDQNRFYIATGYRLSPKADLEIGYLNQYVNGKGNQFTNNHVLQLATYLRL